MIYFIFEPYIFFVIVKQLAVMLGILRHTRRIYRLQLFIIIIYLEV